MGLGAQIGNNVCLYPNGADPMMTEPEMVTIGENACIDSAMLIAHLNTKGAFSLGPLTVGANCVMRTWARLQQGGEMCRRSILMEHTLIMPTRRCLSEISSRVGQQTEAVQRT